MKYFLGFSLCLTMCACSFHQWGKDLGSGLMDGVGEKSDTVAGKTAGGALDTLISEKTREGLNRMIDEMGATLARQAALARDTLLSEKTRLFVQQLKQELLGKETQQDLAVMRNELLGMRTKLLLAQMRDELLGDSTTAQAGRLRDELLGSATRSAVQTLVDSAMMSIVARYRSDLKPELEGGFDFIQKHATKLLIAIAALATGIIAFVLYQKRKFQKLSSVMAFQIHEIPNQNAYDDLTKRIQRKAQETGVEPDLRKVLKEQGLLGAEAWTPGKG